MPSEVTATEIFTETTSISSNQDRWTGVTEMPMVTMVHSAEDKAKNAGCSRAVSLWSLACAGVALLAVM